MFITFLVRFKRNRNFSSITQSGNFLNRFGAFWR